MERLPTTFDYTTIYWQNYISHHCRSLNIGNWVKYGRGVEGGEAIILNRPEGKAWSLYFVTKAKNTTVYRIIPFV